MSMHKPYPTHHKNQRHRSIKNHGRSHDITQALSNQGFMSENLV